MTHLLALARSRRMLPALLAIPPVALAILGAPLIVHPLVGVAVAGAVVLVAMAARVARRHGIQALWMVGIAFSILAGELSAIPLGGQSGRLLWADGILAVGLLVALLRSDLAFEMPDAPIARRLIPWIAWSAFTLLIARDPLTAIAELKEWVVAWLVLAATLSFAVDRARARIVLLIVAWTSALIALLMVESAARSPFGWVLAVLLKKVDLPWGRTNYLAGILILGLPITVGLLGQATTWKARAHALVLLVLQATGLALSASKGAILALVAAMLIAFAPASRASRWSLVTLAAVIGAGAALFLTGPLHRVLEYRMQASAVEYSVGERLDLYQLAWESFLHHPLWGLGLNNFSVAANRLTGVDTVPHHLELGVLAELGLPGLVLLILWVVTLGRDTWRARGAGRSSADRSLGLGVWAAFIAFFVHNQMESTLYGEQYKILLMMTAAAAWRLASGVSHDSHSPAVQSAIEPVIHIAS